MNALPNFKAPHPTTTRACYVCSERGNPVIAIEPCERRFGRPLMPEGEYRFVRCKECSTLYVDSEVDDAYLASFYESETAESIEELVPGASQDDLAHARVPDFTRLWRWIRAARVPRAGEQLLDVGCQTGEFAAIAAEDGVTPFGIELSPDYARRAERRWNRGGSVHRGPLATSPFPSKSFQYVTAFETLEHVCDPMSELRHIRKLLAPDGLLAVSVPSSNYFHFKYWLLRDSPVAPLVSRAFAARSEFYNRQVLPHTHIYNFSHESLRRMLQKTGFEPIRTGIVGWHGRGGPLLNYAAIACDRLSGNRAGLAPSVVAIARPDASG